MAFAARQRVLARLNGVFRNAVVEDVDADAASGEHRYYVHWPDQDRRHDAWLPADDVRVVQGVGRAATPKQAVKVAGVSTRTTARRENNTPPPPTAPPKVALVRVDQTRAQDSKFFSRPRNVRAFLFGDTEVEAWYFTPHPLADLQARQALEECGRDSAMSPSASVRVSNSPVPSPSPLSAIVPRASNFVMNVCPFCLSCFADRISLLDSHLPVCARVPPGREVYRDLEQRVIVFEADGSVHRGFCERLALISKSYLEHKSLDYDTTPFVFYTLCSITDHGCIVAAYFSREKRNPDAFNLSCILTLPQHQGRGLGRFLVEMSYEMSRREGRLGSPEKPLSDLGEKIYQSYWKESVLDALVPLAHLEGLPIKLQDIMNRTGMVQADVVWALRAMKMLDTKSQELVIHLTPQMLSAHAEAKVRRSARGDAVFEPCLFAWRPRDYALATVSRGDLLANTSTIALTDQRAGHKRPRG
jgi:histone acetyltransferase HTATIP